MRKTTGGAGARALHAPGSVCRAYGLRLLVVLTAVKLQVELQVSSRCIGPHARLSYTTRSGPLQIVSTSACLYGRGACAEFTPHSAALNKATPTEWPFKGQVPGEVLPTASTPRAPRKTPAPRAGWVSILLLEWLRNAAQPPGSGTHHQLRVVFGKPTQVPKTQRAHDQKIGRPAEERERGG